MSLSEYDIFQENMDTLKETSKDYSDKSNIKYLTDSLNNTVNFDKVKQNYIRYLGIDNSRTKSVDAIFEFERNIVFVEFKNGKIKDAEIREKIWDSLLIFLEIINKTISFSRDNISLIIVFNSKENLTEVQLGRGTVQESKSRNYIADCVSKMGDVEMVWFGLDRYDKLYFKDVHTYSKEEFQYYLEMNGIYKGECI